MKPVHMAGIGALACGLIAGVYFGVIKTTDRLATVQELTYVAKVDLVRKEWVEKEGFELPVNARNLGSPQQRHHHWEMVKGEKKSVTVNPPEGYNREIDGPLTIDAGLSPNVFASLDQVPADLKKSGDFKTYSDVTSKPNKKGGGVNFVYVENTPKSVTQPYYHFEVEEEVPYRTVENPGRGPEVAYPQVPEEKNVRAVRHYGTFKAIFKTLDDDELHTKSWTQPEEYSRLREQGEYTLAFNAIGHFSVQWN